VRSSVVIAVLVGLLAIPPQAQEPAGSRYSSCKGDDSDARWSETPDRDLDGPSTSRGSLRFCFAHALRSPEKPPEHMPANLKELAQ